MPALTSRLLCEATNSYPQIWAYNLNDDKTTPLTTDRMDNCGRQVCPTAVALSLPSATVESARSFALGCGGTKRTSTSQSKFARLSLLPNSDSPFQPADEL